MESEKELQFLFNQLTIYRGFAVSDQEAKALRTIKKDLVAYSKILKIINEYREESKKPFNSIPAQYVVNEIIEVLENERA